MKKLLIALLFAGAFISTLAQNESDSKKFKNEFGINATPFIKTFLSLSSGVSSYYENPYYIQYRRRFKSGNLRLMVGGNYISRDVSPAYEEDHNDYHATEYSFISRIGWEFTTELSKKWQVYYGSDLSQNYNYHHEDAPWWNNGYAQGVESSIKEIGISPFLGFRFRLNDRLCLTTEGNFLFYWQKYKERLYYIPVTEDYEPIEDLVKKPLVAFATRFSYPLHVTLVFSF